MDSRDGVSQAAGPALNVPHHEQVPKHLPEEIPAVFWELEAPQTQLGPERPKTITAELHPCPLPPNQP